MTALDAVAALRDFFWPRRCEICGRGCDVPARHVCSSCRETLPFAGTGGLCRVCGREVEALRGEYLCDDCRGPGKPMFDRAGFAMRFEGAARDLVLGYKFNARVWLKDDFCDWLAGMALSRFRTDEIDAVVPMPSSPLHRLGRGFNQCAYLAEGLSRRIGRPCRNGVVARTGNPRRQSGLSEEERRENAAGTFSVRRLHLVEGCTILVVDDIMTTGATLSECARALKAAGAKRVWCATLAHSTRD